MLYLLYQNEKIFQHKKSTLRCYPNVSYSIFDALAKAKWVSCL